MKITQKGTERKLHGKSNYDTGNNVKCRKKSVGGWAVPDIDAGWLPRGAV